MLILLEREDHFAFEEIYRRYWSRLFSYAYNRLGVEHAEEIVQEVFLNLWNKRHTVRQINSLQAYLFTAVRFSVLNIIKAENIKRKYAQHFADFIGAVYTNNTDETLSERDLQSALKLQIAKLPPQCRKIFRLSRIEHQSISDIARSLNLSHKTVENQLSKALKTLRIGLAEFFFLIVSVLFFW